RTAPKSPLCAHPMIGLVTVGSRPPATCDGHHARAVLRVTSAARSMLLVWTTACTTSKSDRTAGEAMGECLSVAPSSMDAGVRYRDSPLLEMCEQELQLWPARFDASSARAPRRGGNQRHTRADPRVDRPRR